MAAAAVPYSEYQRNAFGRWVTAGLLTAVTDGLFASVQSLINGSTLTRLWQGVASVLLGRSALDGGASTALFGLLMHFSVAFWWSAVFLFLLLRSSWVRDVLASPYGVIKIACLYGPFIWSAMSLMVIPVLAHRAPSVTPRWFIQFFGHIIFVALPIVWATSRASK